MEQPWILALAPVSSWPTPENGKKIEHPRSSLPFWKSRAQRKRHAKKEEITNAELAYSEGMATDAW
jgi:hypothetical protein